jgi:F-type H+-transporting ATPase subunit b
MSVLATIAAFAAETGVRTQTEHSFLPEKAEYVYGTIASLVIFFALFKFAGPAIKKGMAARTERIDKELLQAFNSKTQAESEAAKVRADKGDIAAERSRLLADADAQAAQMLTDGRARIETEVADLEAKAGVDIESGRGRVAGELQNEVAALASAATEKIVAGSLDDSTHQDLIESFIAKVGATR